MLEPGPGKSSCVQWCLSPTLLLKVHLFLLVPWTLGMKAHLNMLSNALPDTELRP